MLLLEQFHNLTLNPANVARLKELVLQLAVQGKLTETWRKKNPNVEPTVELLKKIEAEKAILIKDNKIQKEKPLKEISLEEISFEIPESWSWCRLNNICKYIQRGKSPSYVDESNVPVISQKCVQWNGFKMDNAKFIDLSTLSKYGEERFLLSNDLLWNSTGDGTIGRAILYPGSEKYKIVVADSHVTVVRFFKEKINPKYIWYFIANPSVQENLSHQVSGSTKQTELNTSTVKSYPIPLPPLAEQEAIVARVEELFKNIEALQEKTTARIKLKKQLGTTALQNLTAATPDDLPQNWQFLKENFRTIFDEAANVKKLRETILQLAVQGKLTQAWRHQNPNTEPASELLKHIQAEKAQLVKEKKIKKEQLLPPIDANETPFELPENWTWCRLGDLTNNFLGGYAYKSPNFYSEGNNQVLRLGNVKNDKLLLSSAPVFIDNNLADESSYFEIFPGDILVTMTGTRAKRDYCFTVLVNKSDFPERRLFLNQRVGCFRLNNQIIKEYIIKALKVNNILNPVFDSATGTANQANIGKEALMKMLLPIPPTCEQEAIVAKVDELMQLCDELDKQIEHANQETEALMQAVVQEALQEKEEEIII
jgi:type I restriction enzyme, S subunit